MANIRKVLQEKFGYTTNIPSNRELHAGPNEDKKTQPAGWQPVEEYRKVIKALMNHLSTEDAGKLEDLVDFASLRRLANKHGIEREMLAHLNTIELEFDKPKAKMDKAVVMAAWKEIQENVPFWFLGLLPHKEEMPEEDKKNLANLMEIMAEINKISKKAGEEAAKDTEHAGRDTAAKKNLDKARKKHDVDTEAASEKKLKQKPETEIKDK
jgi:hypothetical protein